MLYYQVLQIELYIRETRHIDGLYKLSIEDVVFNRDFYDRIAIGSYPIDVQAVSPNIKNYEVGTIYGKPLMYAVPFRCIVQKKIDNLLVAGRSASYSHLAAGLARTIPIGMAEGGAAAVAAVYSIKRDLPFKEIAINTKYIKEIQGILVKQGAYLKPFDIINNAENNWSIDGMKFVLHWGLILQGYTPGYKNNYHFNEKISSENFMYMIKNMFIMSLPQKAKDFDGIKILPSSVEALKKEDALKILMDYDNIKNNESMNKNDRFMLANRLGLILDK